MQYELQEHALFHWMLNDHEPQYNTDKHAITYPLVERTGNTLHTNANSYFILYIILNVNGDIQHNC